MNIEYIKVKVPAGITDWEAATQAILMAAEYQCDVCYTFSGTLRKVKYTDLVKCAVSINNVSP